MSKTQGKRTPLADRLWAKVQRGDGCWEWQGQRHRAGYGLIRRGGYAPAMMAHRAAWEVTHGEVPKGMFVCHHCDNPPCIRPDHLFLGDAAANNADMKAKGRDRNRGEQNGQAKLTERDVRAIRGYLRAGVSQYLIAEQFGVHQVLISMIKLGKRWAHVT